MREESNNNDNNNITAAHQRAPTYAEIVRGRKEINDKQQKPTDSKYPLNIINPDR